MDNREENSRSTEQDRVANPVEETVSTTVEPALSENKRERKKREKAEKKKNAPAQGNSLLGSTMAKVVAFVLMIAAAIVGVLGLYGTCMLADSGAYSSGERMFIHDQLLYRQVNQDLYRIRDWYENESLQTMEAYCRQRNIWVKVESYDLDTDEFLGEWKNEDYVDKTNDLTYRLESQVQHRNDNTYINTETSSASDSYESYGSSESSDIMELEPSVNTGSDVESITAAEQEALSSGNLEKYLDLGDSVSLGGETYVPVERAEQYAKWMIEDALSETERQQEEAAEEALAERNKRIVVTLTVNPSLPKEDEYALIYHQAEQFYDNRNVIPVICCTGTILAFLCFIFLLCSAGHKNGREGITPSAIHDIHLDVYTVVVIVGAFTGLYLAFGWIGMNSSMINLIVLVVLFAAEVIWCTLYCMELAIRLKMGKWWQNTILYRVFRFFGRFCKRVFHGIVKLIRGIPMVWRTALLCLAVCVVEFFGLMLFYNNTDVLLFFWAIEKFILCGAITFVALMCKELQEGSEALADGDLNHKLDTSHMVLSFKEHGENLNRIGEGISAAVEQRMKSEHLKTELITNVSHDIKTPLTSIINYVDLMKRENPTDPKIQEYLRILDEKSQRLKVLTEDVVEASKASTGNIKLEMNDIDFVEMVQQVIGEFEEKFQEKNLTMMVHFTDEPSIIYADGQRMWRVLENVFGNVVKYAMEGTRVYAEISNRNKKVTFSLKNISAQPLNISADELTERFIRGDVARNTEGSGLGLSIAKSLTELQGGEFKLYLDGDLFKVMITFVAKNYSK